MEKHYLESITDPLTGVYNSSYFKQTLTELIEKTKTADESLVLLFCDVDDFKKINDNLGHLYGDQVLRHVSQLICRKVRPTDVVCRYGGEEFVILLPQTNPDTGKQIAEQIRQAVAELGGTESIFPVTISIGLAACPAHDDGSQLVELADQAMYTAKRQGKNKVVSAGELKLHKSRPNLDVAEEKWLMLNTVLSLAESRFYHGEVTDSHSSAVSRYACAIGSKMGMSSEEINRIRVAGLLHDIGMLAIAPSIALKQGELTRFEYELVKAHSVYGYNLLSHIKEMQDILPYVLYHHERPDGKGYPYGLTRIPLGARIISVAEAFDAMVSTAYYRRQPLTKDLAMEELKRGSGTQFDKDVVETFLSVLSRDAQTAGISI
nr:diguanylate cyclase [Brevibacillus fulvus]